MTTTIEQLHHYVKNIQMHIRNDEGLDPHDYECFMQEPELSLALLAMINNLPETTDDDNASYYSACVYALELCIAPLQTALEAHNKSSHRLLDNIMSTMATYMSAGKHCLSFWLPILSAFYEIHIELSPALRDAYMELANREGDAEPLEDNTAHLQSIQALIHELSDLSTFDIAENFFAQSYAMPPEFFSDLMVDLYQLEEGQDVALLLLTHPKQEVRDIIVETFDSIVDSITLNSISLSRLQTIQSWYPAAYHEHFARWIKIQRKKGVIFPPHHPLPPLIIKATEVDGSGAQGIFMHVREKRRHRLCGFLLKHSMGIKDTWITPIISARDVKNYYTEAFDDSIMLRNVDFDYLVSMINHFLAITIARGHVPDLHFLETQELLGIHFLPVFMDIDETMKTLAITIHPFTQQTFKASLKRSGSWAKNKRFTESWYVEKPSIDKLVNQCSSFVDGTKVCRFDEAMEQVFTHEFEINREQWLFHFLWMGLWLRACARKNEKSWEDCFFIAHALHVGVSMHDLPIMRAIVHQSIVNSIETMHNRRAHLQQE